MATSLEEGKLWIQISSTVLKNWLCVASCLWWRQGYWLTFFTTILKNYFNCSETILNCAKIKMFFFFCFVYISEMKLNNYYYLWYSDYWFYLIVITMFWPCCGLQIRPVEEQLKQRVIGKRYCISRKRKSYKGSTSRARLAVCQMSCKEQEVVSLEWAKLGEYV